MHLFTNFLSVYQFGFCICTNELLPLINVTSHHICWRIVNVKHWKLSKILQDVFPLFAITVFATIKPSWIVESILIWDTYLNEISNEPEENTTWNTPTWFNCAILTTQVKRRRHYMFAAFYITICKAFLHLILGFKAVSLIKC